MTESCAYYEVYQSSKHNSREKETAIKVKFIAEGMHQVHLPVWHEKIGFKMSQEEKRDNRKSAGEGIYTRKLGILSCFSDGT